MNPLKKIDEITGKWFEQQMREGKMSLHQVLLMKYFLHILVFSAKVIFTFYAVVYILTRLLRGYETQFRAVFTTAGFLLTVGFTLIVCQVKISHHQLKKLAEYEENKP